MLERSVGCRGPGCVGVLVSEYDRVDVRAASAAIARADVKAIKVKGVGPKLAKRVISELKDKVGGLSLAPGPVAVAAQEASAETRAVNDAFLALCGLEFDADHARRLLGEVQRELESATADDLVRAVLLRA